MTASSNISKRRKLALSDGGADYTAKRAELIALAAKLFRENGYQATRLADIADAAGIDRASLYYYVGSKEELFRESVEGILDANLAGAEAITAKASESVASRLRQVIELVMASYEDNYPHMYVYIQEQMHQVAKEESAWAQTIVRKTRKLESIVRGLIDEGVHNGELRADVPARLAFYALFGMINWTHRWFTPGGPLNARDISAGFFTIFIDGMQSGAGAQAAASPKAPGRRA